MQMKAGCPFPNSPLDFVSGILRPGQNLHQQGRKLIVSCLSAAYAVSIEAGVGFRPIFGRIGRIALTSFEDATSEEA
jgi:hypothetical protein